jgi:hypothetical protein
VVIARRGVCVGDDLLASTRDAVAVQHVREQPE